MFLIGRLFSNSVRFAAPFDLICDGSKSENELNDGASSEEYACTTDAWEGVKWCDVEVPDIINRFSLDGGVVVGTKF
jgi:hypothetical protein